MERWKKVKNFPYWISDKGRVRNAEGRVLRPMSNHASDDYLYVDLRDRGRRRYGRIHILVAEAFLGPMPWDKDLIHHKDFDRTNNVWQNLEYLTFQEHGNAHQRLDNLREEFFNVPTTRPIRRARAA